MKIPSEILDVIDKDEVIQLVRLWGTDLYPAYINKLKEKYNLLYKIIENQE